jgi:hypothetical protein
MPAHRRTRRNAREHGDGTVAISAPVRKSALSVRSSLANRTVRRELGLLAATRPLKRIRQNRSRRTITCVRRARFVRHYSPGNIHPACSRCTLANVPQQNARGELRGQGARRLSARAGMARRVRRVGIAVLKQSPASVSIRRIADRPRRLLAGGRARPTACDLGGPRAQRNL